MGRVRGPGAVARAGAVAAAACRLAAAVDSLEEVYHFAAVGTEAEPNAVNV